MSKLNVEDMLVPEHEQPYAIPDNWDWIRLKHCVTRLQYGYTQSSNIKPVGPRFLRITDIQDNNVDWGTVPYCEISEDEYEKFKIYADDIVIARTGATTGKSFLIKNPPDAVFASYLIRLSPSDILVPHFLWFFMSTKSYWNQISTVSKGIAQPGANASVLGNLAIPLPPLNEQKRIVKKIESFLEKLNEAKDILAGINGESKNSLEGQIDLLIQSILAKAMRGEMGTNIISELKALKSTT